MASSEKDVESQAVNPGPAPSSYTDPAPGYGAHNEAPPNYNDVIDPTDQPPSYDSLFGRVRDAKKNSNSCLDFVKSFIVIFFGTLGCTIMVALVLAIPIAMIVIGSIYLHDCTIEPYIPIYLIVGGVFGVIKNLSTTAQRISNHRKKNDDENAKSNPFDGLISCFLLAWFIAGNVWIYRVHRTFSPDPASGNLYCHPTLYWFAFWITTATYIMLAFICCCMCCAGCIASVMG
ncbi:transmembrane protein 272-like isoform X2 [Tubulanus polymorphus]|uniref:transmembrane protein 272-like isoform X2 n=1 Tax=Tubulanus polymorphus TaxID=672921 RepID=UPI003DA2EA3E